MNFIREICLCESKKNKKRKEPKLYNKHPIAKVQTILENEKLKTSETIIDIEFKRRTNESLLKYFAHLSIYSQQREKQNEVDENMNKLRFLLYKYSHLENTHNRLNTNNEEYVILRKIKNTGNLN